MLTRNCPIKNEVGCGKCSRRLTDRTGRSLPVACSKEYVEILNPDCLYMADRSDELHGVSFTVILLNNEDAAQTKAAILGEKPSSHITRGLYYRGI